MDFVVMAAAAISAISLCWLVFSVLTDGVGWLLFWIVAYALFLAFYFVTTYDRVGWLAAVDRTVTVAVSTAMVIVLIPLVWLVSYIFVKGIVALRPSFFVYDQRGVTPTMPATAGGGLHAIIGTLEQVGLALLISLPLGAMAAIFLNETRSRLRRAVRIFVDAMSGMPSIVSGLFIYATIIIPLAKDNALFGFNGLMASLALSMTMMPTICRAIEVVLRLVPAGLREAGLALGASRARVVLSVVLPTASTGVATAAILGIAREAGETAPLLFTAFGYNLYNSNPFSGPQESLPLFIYRFVRTNSVADIQRGYAGALVLLLLILSLFIVARIIGRDRSVANRRRARSRPGRLPSLLPTTVSRRIITPTQAFASLRPALRSLRTALGAA
ncbi:MAG TPA: phosphate ABC transporter permease PstA [Acidimicrobiales bacterium]|jgi:phosphate transport system permease protein|nr:phosphate ABC transporter permease PstA [Acidimicrobiales bacterium]